MRKKDLDNKINDVCEDGTYKVPSEKKKKLFVIEWCRVEDDTSSFQKPFDWTVWKKYEKKSHRDQAFSDIEKANKTNKWGVYHHPHYFRIPESE